MISSSNQRIKPYKPKGAATNIAAPLLYNMFWSYTVNRRLKYTIRAILQIDS